MRNSALGQSQIQILPVRGTFLVLLVSLLLLGCGGEEFQDLQDFVNNSGADLRGQVDPAPEIKPYEPFPYDNSASLPDPFKARKQEAKNTGGTGLNQPDFARPKQELENFPLESMKMVGYLRKGNTGNAIIRSSEGKLHRVKVGNYIGMNFGQIITISEAEVKIKEMVQDGAGDWLERESSLQLVE
ncbi:MAG: pilus assembly protein PilP [Gallionellales bacterium 35-53-114]|jgi:type IV pilus assembly protein PilP|nr:MAG: pilus assembly protein PilP [Gallionellales bacterium 35-53-114]OYZ62380.1 MAG: pilus assembly protein PilP [Gallionellales bacterium 24-53-125]OZB07419.1 MAG: pilus assembly protein PilP [Gallionellales bacterium 39-52-133]HQS59596.1 pilus assembly protein PilP [Gallionellaceae bacterium]HQS75501.1 pilus assembly protein PilP [Gallionellaceae bacterium]